MKIKSVSSPYIQGGGRGCELLRWIHDHEKYLPGSDAGFAPPAGNIVGAQYHFAKDGADYSWVIFHGLQVIQIVPEEVHSYWHTRLLPEGYEYTGVWEIEESEWIKSFAPRHLKSHKHFVVEFYDDLVEVICRELIFGSGIFSIEQVAANDPRFAYAYLRHAQSQRGLGNTDQAVEYYQKYIDINPNGDSVEYARRCIKYIRTGSAT